MKEFALAATLLLGGTFFLVNADGRAPATGEAGQAPAASPEKAFDPGSYQLPEDETLRRTLTDLQYQVTRQSATEPPFRNTYWDNQADGIYVDIISGEPLFSSRDKYKSGTGWPSFTRPLNSDNIVEKEDRGWFTVRTEVRSRHADSHLGHVFTDGPAPTGLRYCLNSAALRFVPAADLEAAGYPEYVDLFAAEGTP